MPRSSSSAPAFSITGMSLFEPMTMPTRGASTSSSSNSASTTVSVLARRLASLSLDPVHRARGYVVSHLFAIEFDPLGGGVGAIAGLRRRSRRAPVTLSTRPPAVTILPSRSAVPRESTSTLERVDRPQAADLVARRRRLRISARGQNHRHRPGVRHSSFAGEAARRRSPASSSSSRSERRRGSIACVSGSPKRQLYSSTLGPSAVIISPA